MVPCYTDHRGWYGTENHDRVSFQVETGTANANTKLYHVNGVSTSCQLALTNDSLSCVSPHSNILSLDLIFVHCVLEHIESHM